MLGRSWRPGSDHLSIISITDLSQQGEYFDWCKRFWSVLSVPGVEMWNMIYISKRKLHPRRVLGRKKRKGKAEIKAGSDAGVRGEPLFIHELAFFFFFFWVWWTSNRKLLWLLKQPLQSVFYLCKVWNFEQMPQLREIKPSGKDNCYCSHFTSCKE